MGIPAVLNLKCFWIVMHYASFACLVHRFPLVESKSSVLPFRQSTL